jgi:hypothetical protein
MAFFVRRSESLLGTTVAALAAIWTLVWGYSYIFSRFSWYDDEGYLMLSVRQVAEGRPLYDEVFSQYGPFYYLTRLALLAVLQLPLSHDVTRIVTLATWFATAALIGFYLVRTSQSLVVGLIGYLAAFHHLAPLAHEPGHPQELGVLLIVGIAAFSTWWARPAQAPALMAVGGALVSAITLTKINLGVYAAVSLALVVATFAATRFRGAMGLFVGILAVVLPWAIMREHAASWAVGYAALVSLSALAIAVVCLTEPSERPLGLRAMWLAVFAALATSMATCLFLLAQGTSLRGLLHGVLLGPLAFAATFSTEVRFSRFSLAATTLSLLLAVAYVITERTRRLEPTSRAWLFWGLKFAGGMVGCALVFQGPRGLLALGPALLWLVLIRPLDGPWTYERLMPRTVLTALASLQALQAYPVAGSQLAWSTLLVIPSSFLCVSDAVSELWRSRVRQAAVSVRSAALFRMAALMTVLSVYVATADVGAAHARYRSLTGLSLPGAKRVRLPAAEADTYHWLVSQVQSRCSTIITTPGLNSLFFWSGLEPPTGLNTTAWPILLSADEQQRVLAVVEAREDVCVVEYPAGQRTSPGAADINQRPLMRFIREQFQSVEERQGYRILVRRPTPVEKPHRAR